MTNTTKTEKHKEPRGMVVSYFSMKFRQLLTLFLVVCLVCFAGAAPRPVAAQTAPTVSFSPATAVINTSVGNTTVVDVVINNAVNIGGFSVQINYDPSVAHITQHVVGDFFTSALCLTPVDNPGLLQFDCAKIGPPGSNGSGTLAKLTFEAVASSGNSPLSFGAVQLVDATTNQLVVGVLVVPGALYVNPNQIYLPLILKQRGPQTMQLPAEAQTKTNAWLIAHEFSLALPGCAEAQS